MSFASNQFTVLTEAETATLLTIDEAFAVIEASFTEHGKGQARLSRPSAMFMAGDTSRETIFKVKGGIIAPLDVCGFRIVGDVGHEGVHGEHHYCLMLDPSSAAPRALVAQKHIHRLRTAASGLLAAKALAQRDNPTMAVVGAGKIGSEIANGFHKLFPRGRLLLTSRRLDPVQRLARDIRDRGFACEAFVHIDGAIAEAEIILTITTAEAPLFDARVFKPGQTIVGMGEHHELDVGVLHSADRFFADDIDFVGTLGSGAAWIKRGEVDAATLRDRQTASVGAVIAGLCPARVNTDDRVLAIVQGMVIGDLALADLCLRKARDTGVGRSVPL